MENLKFLDYLTSLLKGLYEWAVSQLPAILVLIVITFIVLRLSKFLIKRLKRIIIKRLEDKEEPKSAESAKRVETVWTIFIIILLSKLGLNIGPILAGAGIVGLAVGFGAQELVRDFLSGFFMLLENQIRKGDVAIINGTGGLVESVKLRTITLRDLSGTTHIFQNGKINSLSNMTKEWSAMVFDIGVAYKEDTDHVTRIIHEVGEEMLNDPEYKDKILEPLEIFGVDKFADSAVIIKARFKTAPIMQWTVGREYLRRLKKAFDHEDIEIPFPHTTLYWGENANSLDITVTEKLTKNN
jgi:small-conductance mechanosensitive channel